MSVKVRHYNESTLHITSGIARQEQLEAALKAVFKQIRDHYPDDGYEKAYFLANVITDTKGNIFGYAYAWVSDPRIYFMLIGRNPDGTERYEEYPDPNWVEPTAERPVPAASLLSVGVSWADVTEEEEELDEKYTRPMIRKELPPLVRLPGYRYDEEQLKKATEIVRSKASPDVDPSTIVVPTLGFFEVSRAYVSDVDKEDSNTTLCCRRAPAWVDKDMLLPFFERYSTDRELRFGIVDHKKCHYRYPVITFDKSSADRVTGEQGKKIFVAYSGLAPHDSSFALLMTRKFMIENANDIRRNETLISEGKEPVEVRKTLLVFSPWRLEATPRQNTGSTTGPPVRIPPTIALTTQKIKPLGVARVSGVTGTVTGWIKPPSISSSGTTGTVSSWGKPPTISSS
jgi:hypothetical protein